MTTTMMTIWLQSWRIKVRWKRIRNQSETGSDDETLAEHEHSGAGLQRGQQTTAAQTCCSVQNAALSQNRPCSLATAMSMMRHSVTKTCRFCRLLSSLMTSGTVDEYGKVAERRS